LGWREGQKNNGITSSTASPVLDANVVPAQVQPVAAPASPKTSFDADDKISFQ